MRSVVHKLRAQQRRALVSTDPLRTVCRIDPAFEVRGFGEFIGFEQQSPEHQP